MKKFKLFLLTVMMLHFGVVVSQNTNNNSQYISGYVSSSEGPLSSVNIKIENHLTGTKTASNGFYELETKVGDVVHFSHLGYHKVSIVVEDITDVLNIKMQLKSNELGTALVKARKKTKSYNEIEQEKRTATIMTAVGELNLESLGSSVFYIKGEDLNPAAGDIKKALKGKFTSRFVDGLPKIWDIDGFIHTIDPNIPPPPIDISTIEDVYILTGRSGLARYGGPVLIIRTSNSTFNLAKEKEEVAESYRNQNFYQDDAVALETSEESIANNAILKTITGTITYLDVPVANVHVTSQFGQQKVTTDGQGAFSIEAATGDELKFSHVSYATVYVIIEDVTDVLNLKMSIKSNELEEVYLENKKIVKSKADFRDEKSKTKFETSRGTIDPAKSGFMVNYVDGEEVFGLGHISLTMALVGKFSGYGVGTDGKPYLRGGNTSITQSYPAIWDVDGQIFTEEPPVLPTEIKDIYILKSLGAVVKYGNIANGGVIVIKTTYGDFGERVQKNDPSTTQLQNKEYYANDAVAVDVSNMVAQQFTQAIKNLDGEQEAINYYNSNWQNSKDPHLKIAMAQKAKRLFNYNKLARAIYKDVHNTHNKNPEVLKALAYQYQAIGYKKEAISMYEKVYKLRPTYAQSFRDLANAYIENEQFKRGWRLYLSYLFQGHPLNDEGIGEMLYNEMEWIYFNRKNQTEIRELFMPKNEDVYEFRDDVRVVVEWNTSEAEFDLEFVSPEKRSYVFEHTHAGAQELITKEKKKGYSSKQFFVDDLEEGDWLFNATYYGNKKPEPTYLKVTSFYNWGLPNQTQKINVYMLEKTDTKFQLLRYNKDDLSEPNTVVAQK